MQQLSWWAVRAPRAALAALLLAALAGCGQAGRIPVEGKVTVEAPLTGGTVTFHPDTGRGNLARVLPVGTIDREGKYRLSSGGRPGAPAGWYKVTVAPPASADSTKPLAQRSPVAARFRNPAETPLAVEVVPAPTAGAYDLKVLAR